MPKNRHNWLTSGKYLPDFMRDFHDGKDLFKTIHGFINMEKNTMVKNVSWAVGQCYVIDIFLWFMGMHGYTLQKSRSDIEFLDLNKTMEDQQKERDKNSIIFLSSIINEKQDKN